MIHKQDTQTARTNDTQIAKNHEAFSFQNRLDRLDVRPYLKIILFRSPVNYCSV